MDTIESIKAALSEWIAEDPSRKYLQLDYPQLTKILARADEIVVQRRRLVLERWALLDHKAMVDQDEWIVIDWKTLDRQWAETLQRPTAYFPQGPDFYL